jgi:5'-3' exonuclease
MTNNLLLVDTSYLIFYRFFALRIWYKKAHSDKEIPDDYDWLSDKEFMEKYKKLFFECILKICKKKNIKTSDIFFCIDCKSDNNWRKIINKTYKINRPESHKKSKFYAFGIFKIVINGYLEEFIEKYESKIYKHSYSEADDIVFNMVKNKYNDYQNIYILASDTDYIQICDNKVNLIDCKMNSIKDKYLKDTTKEKYLIKKILSGDVSDNIDPCLIKKSVLLFYNIKTKGRNEYVKVSKKIAEKIVDNQPLFTYLESIVKNNRIIKNVNDTEFNHIFNSIHDDISEDNSFSKNQFMIDMEMTPNIVLN